VRTLIWGAGAIGGTLGAYLARSGGDVTMVDIDVDHVRAIARAGIRVTGPIEEFTVGVPAFTPAALDGVWDDNRRAAKSHTGVWRDLAVRKRPTEVDAQLGIVVRLGEERGVRTPLTTRLVALIHDIERGVRAQSLDALDARAATDRHALLP